MSVAVAHQSRRDGVAVGLVADQDTAEVIASLQVERLEESSEVLVATAKHARIIG